MSFFWVSRPSSTFNPEQDSAEGSVWSYNEHGDENQELEIGIAEKCPKWHEGRLEKRDESFPIQRCLTRSDEQQNRSSGLIQV